MSSAPGLNPKCDSLPSVHPRGSCLLSRMLLGAVRFDGLRRLRVLLLDVEGLSSWQLLTGAVLDIVVVDVDAVL
eukprot:4962746-Pyramimonas_sp.AAC.2